MLSEKTINKYREYIGKNFGCLKVIDIDLSKAKQNRIYFKCTCTNCNTECLVRNDNLENRVFCKKCSGEWRRNNFKEKYKDLLPLDIRHKYIHFKCNAKNRNIPFLLTKEDAEQLCNAKCFYCGKERCLGIDRIDNSKPYVKENCVPCCGCCNRMKMDLDFNFFMEQVRKIYENTNVKSSTTIPKGSTSKAIVDGNGVHLQCR